MSRLYQTLLLNWVLLICLLAFLSTKEGQSLWYVSHQFVQKILLLQPRVKNAGTLGQLASCLLIQYN
jgi:hypothetical protein